MKKGFTFIEVALVLAVAGLIFAMVFIALPALQRSSRDTIRRDDITDFIAAVKKYQTNNRGALPNGSDVVVEGYKDEGDVLDTSWQGFYNKYLGNDFIDPSGYAYKLRVVECGTSSVGELCDDRNTKDDAQLDGGKDDLDYTLLVVRQATCSNDTSVASSNPRNLAVLFRFEGSGVGCNNT